MSKLMKLAFSAYEASTISRPPLVMLHGIFGSKQNWRTVAYQLAKITKRRIYAADLPNHGDSPRTQQMDVMTMTRDVMGFLNEVADIERRKSTNSAGNETQKVKLDLLGHSLGGTLSMITALKSAEAKLHAPANGHNTVNICGSTIDLQFELDKMAVVDMSPHRYRREQGASQRSKTGDSTRTMTLSEILKLLNSVDLSKYSSLPIAEARRKIDNFMAPNITYRGLRAFLRTSLREGKRPDGSRTIEWNYNLDTISRCADDLFNWPKEVNFNQLIQRKIAFHQPVLILGGSASDFVDKSDLPELQKVFPKCSIEIIDGAGHFVQAEQPVAFMEAVLKFLENN